LLRPVAARKELYRTSIARLRRGPRVEVSLAVLVARPVRCLELRVAALARNKRNPSVHMRLRKCPRPLANPLRLRHRRLPEVRGLLLLRLVLLERPLPALRQRNLKSNCASSLTQPPIH